MFLLKLGAIYGNPTTNSMRRHNTKSYNDLAVESVFALWVTH